jgi:hypothetical protein
MKYGTTTFVASPGMIDASSTWARGCVSIPIQDRTFHIRPFRQKEGSFNSTSLHDFEGHTVAFGIDGPTRSSAAERIITYKILLISPVQYQPCYAYSAT